jgi:acyl carrier protein
MKTTNDIVRTALAHCLDLDPSTIESWQHLEIDLHMSRSDLAVVAHEVEEVEDVALPQDAIETMSTVGDLLAFVSRAVARAKPAHPHDRAA